MIKGNACHFLSEIKHLKVQCEINVQLKFTCRHRMQMTGIHVCFIRPPCSHTVFSKIISNALNDITRYYWKLLLRHDCYHPPSHTLFSMTNGEREREIEMSYRNGGRHVWFNGLCHYTFSRTITSRIFGMQCATAVHTT
jgi:hypothetical protein